MGYQLRRGERVLLIGPPEHGKTNQTMWLLEDVSSAVVIDSKQHPDEWGPWAAARGGVVTQDPDEIARHPLVVFQVDQVALDDRHGWNTPGRPGHSWTAALQRCLNRGPTVVVFDEVLQTLPAGQSHPLARRIYTQGRAFGISAWASTQIGNRMDTLVPRLAEHCFAFTLYHAFDLKLLSVARGLDCSPLSELPKHHFGYHRVGTREWTLSGPVDNVIDGYRRTSSRASIAAPGAPRQEPPAR